MLTDKETYKQLVDMNNICECGHTRWEHTEKGEKTRCMYANGQGCKCEEFKLKVNLGMPKLKEGRECLSKNCLIQIEEGKWCSMECKRLFLLDNYSMDASIRAFKEANKKFRKKQKKMLKKIKDSGLTFSEFILSLRNIRGEEK